MATTDPDHHAVGERSPSGQGPLLKRTLSISTASTCIGLPAENSSRWFPAWTSLPPARMRKTPWRRRRAKSWRVNCARPIRQRPNQQSTTQIQPCNPRASRDANGWPIKRRQLSLVRSRRCTQRLPLAQSFLPQSRFECREFRRPWKLSIA